MQKSSELLASFPDSYYVRKGTVSSRIFSPRGHLSFVLSLHTYITCKNQDTGGFCITLCYYASYTRHQLLDLIMENHCNVVKIHMLCRKDSHISMWRALISSLSFKRSFVFFPLQRFLHSYSNTLA